MLKWTDFSLEDRMAWAEWALAHGKEDMSEEERITWLENRQEEKPDVPIDSLAYLPNDAKSEASRLRARRYSMLRRLERVFKVYEVFTPIQAAERTGVNVTMMGAYLNYEAKLSSSRIARVGITSYKIITGFETE